MIIADQSTTFDNSSAQRDQTPRPGDFDDIGEIQVMFRIHPTSVLAAALLLLIATGPAVAAQSAPWQIVQPSDGSLWLLHDGVRQRIAPFQLSDESLFAMPEGQALSDGVLPQPGSAVPTAIPAVSSPKPAAQVSVLDYTVVKGYDGSRYLVGTVQNNTPMLLQRVPLQMNVFDSSGTLIDTETDYVTLDPSQLRGFVDPLLIDSSITVGKAAVQPLTVTPSPPKDRSSLALDPPSFIKAKQSYDTNRATAVVHNTGTTDIVQQLFDVVAFDSSGKVIGGGLGMVSALPAGGSGLMNAAIATQGDAAKIVVYPNW